jgi:hypothetical protein
MSEVYGSQTEIVKSIYQVAPTALEDIAVWLEQRGLRTPISNVVGFQQLSPASFQQLNSGAPETTTSTTWVSMAVDEVLTDIPQGRYLLLWGGYGHISTVAQEGWIGVQINSVDPGNPTLGTYDTKTVQFNTVDNVWNWNLTVATLTSARNTLRLRKAVTNAAATFSIWQSSIFVLRLGQQN